jgi:hypothetical protein
VALEILGGRHNKQPTVEKFVWDMYLPPGGTITLKVKPIIMMPLRGRLGGIFF